VENIDGNNNLSGSVPLKQITEKPEQDEDKSMFTYV